MVLKGFLASALVTVCRTHDAGSFRHSGAGQFWGWQLEVEGAGGAAGLAHLNTIW